MNRGTIDRRRVELIHRLAGEQLLLFQEWAQGEDWIRFHVEDYDDWTFPTAQPRAFGAAFKLTRPDIYALFVTPGYCQKLRHLFELVFLSWGIDLCSGTRLRQAHFHQNYKGGMDRLERLAKCAVLFRLSSEYALLHMLAMQVVNLRKSTCQKGPINLPMIFRQEVSSMIETTRSYRHICSSEVSPSLLVAHQQKLSAKRKNSEWSMDNTTAETDQTPLVEPSQTQVADRLLEPQVDLELREAVQSLKFEEQTSRQEYVPRPGHDYASTAGTLCFRESRSYILEEEHSKKQATSFFFCCQWN